MVHLMRGTAATAGTMERAGRFERASGLTPLPVRKEGTGIGFDRVWRVINRGDHHWGNSRRRRGESPAGTGLGQR